MLTGLRDCRQSPTSEPRHLQSSAGGELQCQAGHRAGHRQPRPQAATGRTAHRDGPLLRRSRAAAQQVTRDLRLLPPVQARLSHRLERGHDRGCSQRELDIPAMEGWCDPFKSRARWARGFPAEAGSLNCVRPANGTCRCGRDRRQDRFLCMLANPHRSRFRGGSRACARWLLGSAASRRERPLVALCHILKPPRRSSLRACHQW